MEKILHEVLAEDESLLSRRDELISALEAKVPANKSRDFASIKKALSLNVGEKFFVGSDDKDATKADVVKILKDGDLQEARIKFVIDTFVKALDWDKPASSKRKKKSPAAEKDESTTANETSTQTKVAKSTQSAQSTKTEQSAQISESAQSAQSTQSEKVPEKPSTSAFTYQPPPQSPPKPTYQPPQKSSPAPSAPSTPSPPRQSPQPSQPTATELANRKNLLIGLVCIVMLAVFYMASVSFMSGRNSNPSTSPPSQDSSVTGNQQTETNQNLPPSTPAEDNSYLNARTNLSLNGIDLGLPVDRLSSAWGEPKNKERRDDGYLTYQYDTIAVGIVDGKVHSFVTEDPKFKTLRGVHVGSTYGEVVDKYGTNSKDMQAGDLTLREYPFTSLDGKYSLLRFAIDNSGSVKYISIREIEEPSLGEHWIKDANGVYVWNPEPQEGERITWNGGSVADGAHKFADGNGVVTWYNKNGDVIQIDEGSFKHGQRNGKFTHKFFPSGRTVYITWDNGKEVKESSSNSGIDKNVEQAAAAFVKYHQLITSGNYSAAFNMFTDRRKNNMGNNVSAFAKGYVNTITSEITDLQLVSNSGDRVVMSYVLDARDRADGGRTLYQQFRGQVEMLKVNGEWKISDTESRRIKEVMER